MLFVVPTRTGEQKDQQRQSRRPIPNIPGIRYTRIFTRYLQQLLSRSFFFFRRVFFQNFQICCDFRDFFNHYTYLLRRVLSQFVKYNRGDGKVATCVVAWCFVFGAGLCPLLSRRERANITKHKDRAEAPHAKYTSNLFNIFINTVPGIIHTYIGAHLVYTLVQHTGAAFIILLDLLVYIYPKEGNRQYLVPVVHGDKIKIGCLAWFLLVVFCVLLCRDVDEMWWRDNRQRSDDNIDHALTRIFARESSSAFCTPVVFKRIRVCLCMYQVAFFVRLFVTQYLFSSASSSFFVLCFVTCWLRTAAAVVLVFVEYLPVCLSVLACLFVPMLVLIYRIFCDTIIRMIRVLFLSLLLVVIRTRYCYYMVRWCSSLVLYHTRSVWSIMSYIWYVLLLLWLFVCPWAIYCCPCSEWSWCVSSISRVRCVSSRRHLPLTDWHLAIIRSYQVPVILYLYVCTTNSCDTIVVYIRGHKK